MKKLVFFVILLLISGYFYYNRKGGEGKKTAATVEAVRQTIIETVEVSGDVKPEILIEVKPEISARILKIHVKESDVVKKGQVLIDLDRSELLTQKSAAETEIAIAELQLAKANRDLLRQEKLLKGNIITEQEFRDAITTRDVAEQGLRKTKQQLETIASRLDKTTIIAPLDGTVLSLPIVENQVVVGAASVNSGTLLMSVADLSQLIIAAHVNQVDVARLTVGMPLEFKVDSLGDTKMSGTVQTIAPMATIANNIKGYVVHFKIDEPDARLRPGMTAEVTIPTQKAENVTSLPISAIFANQKGSKIVYLENISGKAIEKPVEIGIANNSFAQIKSGVEVGAKVLLAQPTPKS